MGPFPDLAGDWWRDPRLAWGVLAIGSLAAVGWLCLGHHPLVTTGLLGQPG